MAKLKDILAEAFDDTPKVDKHKVIEGVKSYGVVGKALYNGSNIMELAAKLGGIAEAAHSHILGEQDDWFDKISINKNMKHLKGSVMEFQKTAKEAHMLNQRLTGLYEDVGHILNRYYEISEGMDDPAGEGIETQEESLDPDNRDQVDQPSDPAKDGEETKESLDHNETLADKPDKEGEGRVNDLDSTPKSESWMPKPKDPIRLKDIVNSIATPKATGKLGKRHR